MMNMNIGNKIRELRKQKGITQDQLASALGVSPQAVSKWEMCGGYPDVATLPVIAGYFGVSMDTLFNYDAEKLEEKIEEIWQSAQGCESFEIAEKRLLDGIAAYPGAEKLKVDLLDGYATQIQLHDRADLIDKALDIGTRLIAESNNYFITSWAKYSLACIHKHMGNYEETKKIVESLPYVYHLDIYDRMRCTANLLHGEEQLNAAREWKQWAQQELFMVCSTEGHGFFEKGDYENALLSYQEEHDVIERFRHRKTDAYHILGGAGNQGIALIHIAGCLYKLGRIEECEEAINKGYHLIRDGKRDEVWEKTAYHYRNIYNNMGLNEYKPCFF